MKKIVLKPLVLGVACALASGHALADQWADQVAGTSGTVSNANNALHAPDANTASMAVDSRITVNFLDNICTESPVGVTASGSVADVSDNIIGFPDVFPGDVGWSNQVTLQAGADGAELDAIGCDSHDIYSWAKFGGVIGDRTVKGNEKTQNVSFKGVAYSAGNEDTVDVQVGWLEVNYRNGVSCNFYPFDIENTNQLYESDGDQRLAYFVQWHYECSNEDIGPAWIVLLNAATTSFDLGGGESVFGVPAGGTYYLPEAKGKGRTKFRGAICIWADNGDYSVDGGSNVLYDDGVNDPIPMCDNAPAEPAPDDNSGDLQWGEINIGGNDYPTD